MKARICAAVLCTLMLVLGTARGAEAASAPGWSLDSVAVPTNFLPGGSGEDSYQVTATNIGGAATNGSALTLTDELPAGIEVERVELQLATPTDVADFGPSLCTIDESSGAATIGCAIPPAIAGAANPTTVRPGESLVMVAYVAASAASEGPLTNRVTIEGGGLPPVSAEGRNAASARPPGPGLSEFRAEAVGEDGRPYTQAGGHPFQYVTTYAVNTETGPPTGAPFLPSGGNLKDIEVALPPGFVGDPTAVSTCSRPNFLEQVVIDRPSGDGQNFHNGCPAGSVVGFIVIRQLEGLIAGVVQPIYELEPPLGMPAQLGFDLVGLPFFIDTKVRSGGDYGVTAYLPNLAEVKRVSSASVVLWGVPGAASHDAIRGDCLNELPSGSEGISAGTCPASVTPRPFLTDATSCGEAQSATFSFDTWLSPGAFLGASSPAPANVGCGAVPFPASLMVRPQTGVADSPTGIDVDLHVEGSEGTAAVAPAHLRDATVKLPAGLAVNPSSAAGLGSCSAEQVGLTSPVGSGSAIFDTDPANCPADSKLGTVTIDTPLLDHPIEGAVFLADQGRNPFGTLIALYIAAADERSGVVVKLAGRVDVDPATGQLTATFANNPQLPFEDLRLHFFEGPAAALRTPASCGIFTTTADLRPWSAPQSGPDATPSDSFSVTASPAGPCPTDEAGQPNGPSFEAGTESGLAGAYSPFVLRIGRADGTQRLRRIDLNLPKGLLGKLAGVAYCSDSRLAAAAATSGREEQSESSCPASSEVGQVTVTAGAGPRPISVTGAAYLAGPYEGAPLSLAIVTPAVAGPFDLGTVVVRSAISVDPLTAQINLRSDPIPTMLQGIPLDVRSVAVHLARPGFTLNPTSCASSAITASSTSPVGVAASLSTPFGVGGCRALAFSPKLSLRLKGGTTRGKDPSLRTVLTQPAGQANIAGVSVTLPPSLFVDPRHIDDVCTRVQFAANECPAASVLGTAHAYTPLLDRPLSGRVILRSNGGARKLPDLVADLHGQIDIELVGYIDSVRKRGSEVSRVRTRFAHVPDAPVSKFVLRLKGGRYGLLRNSRNLCKRRYRSAVKMTGQNGRVYASDNPLGVTCRSRAHP